MRKSETHNISEIIQSFLKQEGLEDGMARTRLITSWEEVLGKSVGRVTKNLYIRNRTLYVHLHSSVVRNELMMIRDDLITRLNEKAGKKVIDKIVLR